jgi:acyl-coenzyme A synthetase/AMP-(fatty) acid ligase
MARMRLGPVGLSYTDTTRKLAPRQRRAITCCAWRRPSVLETPEPIDEADLRQAVPAHLGNLPAPTVHFIGRLPRNHIGKVERFTLKQRLIEKQLAEAGT